MKKVLLVLLSILSLTCFLTACNENNNEVCSHSYSEWNIVDEATCLEEGLKSHTCSKCGDVETQIVEAFGHTEVVDVRVEPTCTSSGLTEGKHCSSCNTILINQETLGKLEHIEVTHEAKTPTCTNFGWHEYVTCERQGCNYSTYNEISANGHTDGEWITDTNATCTENGSKHQVCSVCSETIKTETITTIGHTDGDWLIDTAPTCTDEGIKHQVCSVCNDTIKIEPLPTILTYTLSNGTYEITDFIDDGCFELVIPSEYNGKAITSIGNSAFANAKLTTVVLPNTITSIKSSAFSNCQQLENITLSSNLTFIANNAFNNCPKLIEYIQDNITADTTWGENKKIYIIKNSFQIKQQTKLEIVPGTVVLGNGATIINFGNIIAHGASDYPIKCFNLHFGLRQGTMDFEYLELRTGSFSNGASSSSNSYGLKFNACSFYDSTEYSYIWYPKLLDIQNCYFENWDKLSIGTSLGTGRGATIMYNTFVNSGTIDCWAAYGEILKVNYNNFINPKSYALSVKYNSGRMDGKYNWFGTTDVAKIEKLIYDGNDDFELNTIDYSEYLIKEYE